MKYLGLVLDSKWTFTPHFVGLAPRARAAARNLSRLMPNLGGPGDRERRLYMGVVQSIVLYGAPVWYDKVAANRRCRQIMNDLQRRLAIRLIRGYRTTSCTAACAVAGSIPWILLAAMYTETYQEKVAGRLEAPGEGAQPPQLVQQRRDARRERILRRKIAEWQTGLSEANQGCWTVEAIRPVLDKWVGRSHGSLSYRLVQVLTGHGCTEHKPLCSHSLFAAK